MSADRLMIDMRLVLQCNGKRIEKDSRRESDQRTKKRVLELVSRRRSVSTSSIELLIALATELSQEIEPFPVSGYRKSASFPSRA